MDNPKTETKVKRFNAFGVVRSRKVFISYEK